ncbi:MAG TPA: hypothetical protein PK958_11620 [Rhodocyclaceae bacterium]|uniref:hypothetical protein n=1 Tax=Accumulibacter sp. TaxID=2053492 RepID=UPI001A3D04B2|nr:hypothetical protein [Accumulibacter sp.]MBL8492627.1 hypothetical protein [Rhodocyclaceae bacterium]HNC20505.1 hypothetical protein [Accumulibacter sp.]HNH99598.1 hypothetical protein [Rhodocyclaceae bacterium]
MLTSGRRVRFTTDEIKRHARIGLEVGDVRTVEEFAREVERWALVMSEVRPDVVLKLEQMLRESKSEEPGKADSAPHAPALRDTSG